MAPVIGALRHNHSLTELKLPSRPADDHVMEAALAMLEVNSTIQTFDCPWHDDGPGIGFRIAAAIRTNSTLTSCRLGMVEVSDAGADAIEEAVAANASLLRLEVVHRNRDPWSPTLGNAIARGLATNTTLTELRMNGAHGVEPELSSVMAMLKANSTLTTLELGCEWMEGQALARLSSPSWRMRCESTVGSRSSRTSQAMRPSATTLRWTRR